MTNFYVYYIDSEKFTTDYCDNIPWDKISSPSEETPAFENLETGQKIWCEIRDRWHRLTGPARILPNETCQFYLNGKRYETIKEWIEDHPEPDLYFHKMGMNETDKVLWFLQN
jgi:hypothetical protein